jgi:hypothetical protein
MGESAVLIFFTMVLLAVADRDWDRGNIGRAVGMWIAASISGLMWIVMWALAIYFRGYV